jgi:hypothetical protein
MMKMSRSKLTLNIQQIIEITLGIEDYSAVLKGHPQYQAAQDWHDDLTDAFEAAIHCPEASVLKIVQKPVMTVHDAKATRESVAEWFMLVDERDMADKIYPDSAILTISRADLAEILELVPTEILPTRFHGCEIAEHINQALKRNPKKSRTEPKHLEVIEALLLLISEIKDEKSRSKQFEIIETLLAQQGVAFPVDKRTFQRW